MVVFLVAYYSSGHWKRRVKYHPPFVAPLPLFGFNPTLPFAYFYFIFPPDGFEVGIDFTPGFIFSFCPGVEKPHGSFP